MAAAVTPPTHIRANPTAKAALIRRAAPSLTLTRLSSSAARTPTTASAAETRRMASTTSPKACPGGRAGSKTS